MPVQILSLGSNGGDTKQSNNSTAESAAANRAGTDQSVSQHQSIPKPDDRKGHDRKGHDGYKPDDHKGHGPKGHDGYKPDDHKGHGPKGHDGYKPDDHKGHGPKGHDGYKPDDHKGHDPKGHDGYKPDDHKGHDPKGHDGWKPEPPAVQKASQKAWTDQDAKSEAKSKQFLPVNVNAPVQILSLGHNGGDTKQSNNSTAESTAINQAETDQSAKQYQQAGKAPAFQGRARKPRPTRTPSRPRRRSRSCPST